MTDPDDVISDEELDKAVKNGTMRQGYARVHHKLFPKYGFLIPEEALFVGETIFFGITAHVDASKRYIADLRDEFKIDQRVQYMAVPQDREGVIKWKGMVVSPVPSELQYASSHTSDESNEENKQWLTCTILPNLQPHRGFATPEGYNQYCDNVYFTTREASEGLGIPVSDLREVFKVGEVIKALVVTADPRYKARFRALKISKILGKVFSNSFATTENKQTQIEERDRNAVSWIYSVLKLKGKVRISRLVGNLSNDVLVRAVIQPKKRSLKKFISKYPEYFRIKDNVAMLNPSCPPQSFDMKVYKFVKSIDEEDWSDSSNSSESSSGDEYDRESAPSPVQYSSEDLKSIAQVSSKFTVSMLASIINSLPEACKMLEVFRICQQKGWDGMLSVAMIAQVVTNNPKYFMHDSKGCIILTHEGSKLSVKRIDGSSKTDEKLLSEVGLTDHIEQSNSKLPGISSTPDFYNNNRIFSIPLGATQQSCDPEPLTDKLFPASYGGNVDGGTDFENGNVYQSDPEDSFEENHKAGAAVQTSRFSEGDRRFLSVVAQAIFPKAARGAESVFAMLKKELDNMGITQSDSDGDRLSGLLASHLLCMQMDAGAKPKAIFKHFTPSGKITQTRVTLPAEKMTLSSLKSMLDTKPTNLVSHVGKKLYGIGKTHHCIRIVESELGSISGYIVSYRSQDEGAVGTPDIDFGDRRKVKILLTNANGSNSTNNACKTLKEYATSKCEKSAVTVIDMEGQIFGFGLAVPSVKRIICSNLDSQQHYLKEVVHYHSNVVVINAIDSDDSLKLLKRISAKGIAVYAEVEKSLESNVRKIFDSRK